ncbi:MAG: alpha/beta hydrolase [Acidimicrobiales bacterium]
MTAEILPGCEPFSSSNGPNGVLVLHGFTGSPQSMRALAEAFADAGLSVELPLLPGHGTSVDDMVPTRWEDWFGAVEQAHQALAAHCDRVAVAGLSMGGTLALALAQRHAELAGLVLVNPLVEPAAESFVEMMCGVLESGTDRFPGIGSDIAQPEKTESAYDATPIEPLLSLMEAARTVEAELSSVTCPILLLSSRSDHVVPPSSGDVLVAGVSGPVERVYLERSFHVATLDYDQAEIEQRAVQFVSKILAA